MYAGPVLERGRFVTFEGGEGAGKTTVLAALAERLRAEGQLVVTTREPGAGELGKRIRSLLLDGEDVPHRAELLLFLADRAQHVELTIQPALDRGEWVLCDRFTDSTTVYQSLVRGLPRPFVDAGNAFATGGLSPDRTFLLDLPAELGLARVVGKNRMDHLPLEFHQAVRAGFLELAEAEPNRFRVIDAQQPAAAVLDAIWEELRS